MSEFHDSSDFKDRTSAVLRTHSGAWYRIAAAILILLGCGLLWFQLRRPEKLGKTTSARVSTESGTPGTFAGIEKPPPIAGAKRDYVSVLRDYIQSSKNRTRALYIAALIDVDSEFADEVLREFPDSSEARMIDYLRNASWDPKQLEASYELALRLQAADPHSNLGSLLALGYKNFVPNTKGSKEELLEQVLSRTPRVWPIGHNEILEATGMLLSAGYTTEEAKSMILERSSHTQTNISEVAKKGIGVALSELRTLQASGDDGKAINLVSGILPTLRQFEMAPTQDYQLVVFANGFESAMLKLLPQDASYVSA